MEKKKRPLIIITGPTAVGKTAISIMLAKELRGEIISADSMQIYRGMDIGTAKVTPEEMDGIKHYLIDELDPAEEFNVARFQKMAKAALEEIYSRGKIPIIAGGTGFYIQAVLYDVDFVENDGDDAYRKELWALADTKGPAYLYDLLLKTDREAAGSIHENNIKRVIRALEYHHQTGRLISQHNEEQRQKESPYDFLYFVLTDDRQLLYERIEKRVSQMMEAGLLSEVRALIEKGCTRDMVSMQGIGYQEFFDYFEGKITLQEAVEKLCLDTRHFAKRQLTWFKREKDVVWMDYTDFYHDKDKMLQELLRRIGEHYGNGKNI